MYSQIYCNKCYVLVFDVDVDSEWVIKQLGWTCPHCQHKQSEEFFGNFKVFPSKYIRIKEMDRPDMKKEEYTIMLEQGDKWT